MKTIPLKKLLILFALPFVFGCNKKSGNDYFVKLKINGNWITWEKNIAGELGPDLADPSKTDLGITANDDDIKDVFDIAIQVDGTNFSTGTYQSDNFVDYFMIISYFKNVGTGNSTHFTVEDDPAQSTPSKYTVHITEITNTTIRGNFTGNYLHDSFEDETLLLTEGEFFVRRVR